MAIVRCSNCPGFIDDQRFDVMRLPKTDEEGFPVLDPATGEVRHVYVRLPKHVSEPSRLDPTGLAPSSCVHGLPQHPDPAIQADRALSKNAVSWVRSKYLTIRKSKGGLPLPGCPVCFGEPRPDDLTTARA